MNSDHSYLNQTFTLAQIIIFSEMNVNLIIYELTIKLYLEQSQPTELIYF